MCHSYSADALDFDLARIEDSLFVKAFPKMRRELWLPGMRLPESDSLYMDSLSAVLLQSEFADGKKLEDFSPWQERDSVEQKLVREPPKSLRNLLNELEQSIVATLSKEVTIGIRGHKIRLVITGELEEHA